MSYARHLSRTARAADETTPEPAPTPAEPGTYDPLERQLLALLDVAHDAGEDRTVRELVDEVLDSDDPDVVDLLETQKMNGPYLTVRRRLDRLARHDLVRKVPRDEEPRSGSVVYLPA
jgi:hypothetical protein